jgi:hypothetical protein
MRRKPKLFPIMDGKYIRAIPWGMILPHEKQAWVNHDQSLEILASRGGLDPCEALAVLSGKRWREIFGGGLPPPEEVESVERRLAALLGAWEAQL